MNDSEKAERSLPLKVTLDDAWRRVGAVEGPKLGDVAAPLAARCEAFSRRLRAFRYVGSDQALARLIDSWGDRAGRDVVDEEYEAERKDMYGGEISSKGRGSRPRRPWARGGRWGTHRGAAS